MIKVIKFKEVKFFDESDQASSTAKYLNIENKNTADINYNHSDDLIKIVYFNIF